MERQKKQTDAEIIEEAIRGSVGLDDYRSKMPHGNSGLSCAQVATAFQESSQPLVIKLERNALAQGDYDKVEELELPKEGLRDISRLARLRNLEFLQLDFNPIQDFSPLAGMVSLTDLHLEKTGIQDLSFLANLKNLTTLTLADNPLTDYTPLFGLTKLESLDIQYCEMDWDSFDKLERAFPNCDIIHDSHRSDDDWD